MELSDNAIDKLLSLSSPFVDNRGRLHYYINGCHIYCIHSNTWTIVGYAVYRGTAREVAREALAKYAR